MSDILCLYYSRSGNTKKAMLEMAETLGAELVELHDAVERGGWKGWLRCGMDAMKKTTQPLSHFETDRPLEDYRLVILGTPVWAGRCSSVMRAFLKDHGQKLQRVAYVVTRSSDGKNEEVYDQMDLYTARPHQAAVSLRSGSVGYAFWQEEFLRQVRELLKK
ncbi:flavodoxin family protein [Dysosmobacter sp.]